MRTDTTGWGDWGTLALIVAGIAVIVVFLVLESNFATVPLLPLQLFRSRNLSVANVIIVINSAASFAMWFFFSVYLQAVKGYTPVQAGLTFLPMNASLIITARVVSRAMRSVGAKRLQILGMLVMAVGLALFARITVTSDYLADLLVPSLMSAIGMQIALIPATISATSDVDPRAAGLAAAVTNTARLLGSALGLAILATIAAARTNAVLALHPTWSHADGLVSGFRLAFVVGALMALGGALLAALLMPRRDARPSSQSEIVPMVEV